MPVDSFGLLAKAISTFFEETRSSNLSSRVIEINTASSSLIRKYLGIYHLLFATKNRLIFRANEKHSLWSFEANRPLQKKNQIHQTREKMQSAGNLQPSSSPVSSNRENDYKALLTEQIESINQWNDLSENKRKVAVKNFMNAIGHLYLDYYQFHLDESKACALKHQSLIENSIDDILTYTINLGHALRTADDMDDPWEAACWGRTNIEAVISMFGEPMKFVDSGGIEEYMQDRKGNAQLKNSLIPKNVPSSHWWWFEEYR